MKAFLFMAGGTSTDKNHSLRERPVQNAQRTDRSVTRTSAQVGAPNTRTYYNGPRLLKSTR